MLTLTCTVFVCSGRTEAGDASQNSNMSSLVSGADISNAADVNHLTPSMQLSTGQ